MKLSSRNGGFADDLSEAEDADFGFYPNDQAMRQLEEDDDAHTWEIVYTCTVLVVMFAALISDRFGTDSVMLGALTLFMASEIITIKEGLAGFANEGLLTVLILFVVAEGISKTGALDWYMGKLLGRPKSSASAQLRLMVPIAILSAFLNNTPIVAVMIPIVQKWSKNIGISPKQLMIPLSFATILGGTCSLIGTSTNLVVKGLLDDRYGDDGDVSIGLFDIGKYGVPVALAGMGYILLVSSTLLPGDKGKQNGEASPLEDIDEVLLGARLKPWSPAAGRSVKRSGLRDTGGIYLVSVRRFKTGNIHRAVGQEFILNVGDILYFTGLVESFGDFCLEHGLEIITNEVESSISPRPFDSMEGRASDAIAVSAVQEDLEAKELGDINEPLVQSSTAEHLRSINLMADTIRGDVSFEAKDDPLKRPTGPTRIFVAVDQDAVVVGVDTRDRPALLLDVLQQLVRLNLQLHHTEAAVVGGRSLSIWRSETTSGTRTADPEEIRMALMAILEVDSGNEAFKRQGLRVIRAQVTPFSRLLGQTPASSSFRGKYKAAIVAVQRAGRNINTSLSTVVFEAGDSLVLQASDDSPLVQLEPPSEDFYRNLASRNPSVESAEENRGGSNAEMAVFEDLEILKQSETETKVGTPSAREFLTAMTVAPNSALAGKNASQAGLDKLPGAVIVSIERPISIQAAPTNTTKPKVTVITMDPDAGDKNAQLEYFEEQLCSNTEEQGVSTSVTPERPLQVGDVLWFAGSASALGDLRRIPGLSSYESEEVAKMNEKVHDRRLVQAVIARQAPLVGKTVKEVHFRTQYGAAVIAVHREGKRIYDHPGNVILQSGDVLLLEAGSTFIGKSAEHETSFALFSEVKDSAPPRLNLLMPALVITVAMLAVFTAQVASLLVCGLVAAMLMVALGILSEQEARDAVKWEVFITISCAFGIGTALENSGVAEAGASFLVDIGEATGMGDAGLLGAVYFATFLISNVLTNNAAAALVFPLAIDAAESTGTDKVLMCYCLMLGASASFATPFGYQTNLMVYGPGGYTSRDFLAIGIPMQLLLWVLTTFYLANPSLWWLSWLFTSAAFVGIASFCILNVSIRGVLGRDKQAMH